MSRAFPGLTVRRIAGPRSKRVIVLVVSVLLPRPALPVPDMQAILRRAAGLVLLIALLAGCGSKGPLFLPTPEGQPRTDNDQRR